MKLATKRREQLMLYAPLFLWIGVIFLMSSSQGSMNQTSRIIRPLLEFLFPAADEQTLILYHASIRKFAHFAEYAVLGLLACRAFVNSSRRFLQKYFYLVAGLLVLLVASADELNQSSRPDRTASPIDVMIDFAGGVIAVFIFYFLTRSKRSTLSAN